MHNLKHNKILHERNVVLTSRVLDAPLAPIDHRFECESIGEGFYRATVSFGFAEDPDIPARLALYAASDLDLDSIGTTYFASRETIVPTERSGMGRWRNGLFAFLTRNAQRATDYFAVPPNRLVEIGTRVEI